MKFLSALVVIILFQACTNDKSNVSKKDEFASAFTPIASELDKHAFFGVYQLSEKTTAIVIPLHDPGEEASTFFDSAVSKLKYSQTGTLIPDESYYVDTSGDYKLVANKTLSQNIRSHINSSYFIYGTKGFTKVFPSDIVFALDECRTSFIAITIPGFDTAKFGKPLLCTDKLINMRLEGSYTDLEKEIAKLQKAEESDYGYLDSIPVRVFGNAGHVYFAYGDDFLWGRAMYGQKCFFPSRQVYTKRKNSGLERIWSQGLDLFGIPCD